MIRRTLSILLLVLTLCAFSSGCAVFKRVEKAEAAKSELIGFSKTELLSCAGVPVRSEKVGEMEFLTYVSDATGIGFFRRSKRYCEATFTLRNGVVENVSYSGNTGGRFTEYEQCAFIINSCVSEDE